MDSADLKSSSQFYTLNIFKSPTSEIIGPSNYARNAKRPTFTECWQYPAGFWNEPKIKITISPPTQRLPMSSTIPKIKCMGCADILILIFGSFQRNNSLNHFCCILDSRFAEILGTFFFCSFSSKFHLEFAPWVFVCSF